MRRLRDLLQGFAGGFPLARKREIYAVDVDVGAGHRAAVTLDGRGDGGVEATRAVTHRHRGRDRKRSQDDDQNYWTHKCLLARRRRSMRGLRDLLQRFAGRFPLAGQCEIAERHDAHEALVAVDDGQAANLLSAAHVF